MFKQNKQGNEMDQWVEERLSDYLDGTLSPQDRARVEAHLQTSAHARASLESLRWTVNLLKQTPAPPLPRQFTLPVTSRAPAKAAAPWLVWSLRGIAVAATAAFVVLLIGTWLRQDAGNQTAMLSSEAPAQPTVIALAPTNAPTAAIAAPAAGNAADNSAQEVTPLMVTAAPPPTSDLMPITIVPPAAAPSQPEPTQAPGQAQKAQPTAASAATNEPQPTVVALQAPTETAVSAASDAAGSAPEIAPASESPTEAAMNQRAFGASLQGIVTPQRLQVRTGPGKEYPVLGVLRRGDRIVIIGISQNAEWLAIEYVREDATVLGWLARPLVQVQGVFDTLPVLPTPTPEPSNTPELTATPTETPTELPTTTPTP